MSEPNTAAKGTSATGPIGIVVAMVAELRHLLEAVGGDRDTQAGIWTEHHLIVAGTPVVAVRSGMGTVNAAAATEAVLDRHQPRALLNFGCSGAHRRDIMPGDVVVGERAVHHAAVHLLASGEEHFVGSSYEVGGESMDAAELAADPHLLSIARDAATGWTPEPWPRELGWPASVPPRAAQVHQGVVASADIWTQQHARLDILHQRHGSLCEDMEAAAIAHICARHAVPFLTIKDISNNEYHAVTDISEGFTSFPTAEVGKRAATLTLRVLERLASGG